MAWDFSVHSDLCRIPWLCNQRQLIKIIRVQIFLNASPFVLCSVYNGVIISAVLWIMPLLAFCRRRNIIQWGNSCLTYNLMKNAIYFLFCLTSQGPAGLLKLLLTRTSHCSHTAWGCLFKIESFCQTWKEQNVKEHNRTAEEPSSNSYHLGEHAVAASWGEDGHHKCSLQNHLNEKCMRRSVYADRKCVK